MIKYLLKKEFKQIIRHPFLPKMIFMFPLMVLLVFPWAASYEIKNLNLSVIDNDHSSISRRLTQTIVSSNYFRLADHSETYNKALKSIENNKADLILEIPRNFEKSIINHENVKVMISPNAVNGMKGGVGMTYLAGIIGDFNNTLVSELYPEMAQSASSIIQID